MHDLAVLQYLNQKAYECMIAQRECAFAQVKERLEAAGYSVQPEYRGEAIVAVQYRSIGREGRIFFSVNDFFTHW